MNKKMVVIGVGGKTGTMFTFELKKALEILGVGKEKEVKLIKEEKIFIERNNKKIELFREKVVQDNEFSDLVEPRPKGREKQIQPDFILLAIKNPIGPVIKFYYQKFKNKEKIPALLVSQNGLSPFEDAKKTLKEIFGKDSEKIKIVRIILFNPIRKKEIKEIKEKILINYSLPIKIALAPAFAKASAGEKSSDQGEVEDLVKIFKKAGFEVEVFPEKETQNLEFSKLFLNLIGMASASRDIPVKKGLLNPEIFKEELLALREYIKVVKAAGGEFLNFSRYPVKLWAFLLNFLPSNLLLIFRPLLSQIISQEREEKSKELDEIEFYNGAVVKLGKKLGIEIPVNEKIFKRVMEKLNK